MLAYLQRLGKSLMLPIAVLPVAAILLRLGQEDLLNVKWLSAAGDAIFGNLALIFAIGVGVGLAKDSNGAAGLSSVVAYLIMTEVMKAYNFDPSLEKQVKLDMGVLGGIIAGIVGGEMYNKFKDITLPDYLLFFAGRRFVPIVSGIIALGLGLVFGITWPTIQNGLNEFSQWLISLGPVGVGLFGFFNRLLIPTGLHHVLNSYFWFIQGEFFDPAKQKIVTGDLTRFFAKDPSAGDFMSGFFPIMMFGILGICTAIYLTTPKEHKKKVAGVLVSLGLTSFLTGITEPVEFLFMFTAPALYAIHAVLTGISLGLASALEIKVGFGFSAGLIDYVLNFGISTKPELIIPIGLAFYAIYTFIFTAGFKTLGKDMYLSLLEESAPENNQSTSQISIEETKSYIEALGGIDNVLEVGSCITRLRVTLKDNSNLKQADFTKLGARGVVPISTTGYQVILGAKAEKVANAINNYIGQYK